MKFIKNKILIVSLPLAMLLLVVSCSKENIDFEELKENPIEVEVEIVESECGNMTVTSSEVNFDGDSHTAILHRDGNCNFAADYPYNFIVVDANFDFQDGLDHSIFNHDNVFPGFLFQTEELPQVGDEVIVWYHTTSFGQGTYEFVFTSQQGIKLKLTEVGSQVGENIAGKISAEYYNINDPGTIIPFTATFCSPITVVCD